MKYNDNGTYKDIYVKAFDTLPIGAIVEYDGATIPSGWEDIGNDKIKKTSQYIEGGLSISDIYPVGSIYISVNNTNPSSFFGGTWEAFGAGRVLVGQDINDTDFDTLLETGGSKKHTHSYQRITTTNAVSGSGVIGQENNTTEGISLQPYIVVSMWKRTA